MAHKHRKKRKTGRCSSSERVVVAKIKHEARLSAMMRGRGLDGPGRIHEQRAVRLIEEAKTCGYGASAERAWNAGEARGRAQA